MTRHRFPPIRGLIALEAAVRTGSFTETARELNITQAAVSYQIRNLEQILGVELFNRHHNKLSPTSEAMHYLPHVQEALQSLSNGSEVLKRGKGTERLTVSVSQSLASRWLAHRILHFTATFLGCEVHLDATDDLIDFSKTDIDIAIRYAQSIDPSLDATLLSTDQVFPICSPNLKKDKATPLSMDDLTNHTLLHDEMTDVTWQNWLGIAGVDLTTIRSGLVFSHSSLTVDAALATKGVALGRSLLVADELAAGNLIKPFDLAITSSFAYFIVHPPVKGSNLKVLAMKAWLLNEARKSEQAILNAGV